MDRNLCSLCGGLCHPKNKHLCYLKEGSKEDSAASFVDKLDEIANNLERSLNIPSDEVSNSRANRDETDLSCWLEHEQKNTFPHPDQNCRSPIPAQFSGAFELSTPCSSKDSRQTVFDSPIQNSANPSIAQIEKLQLDNSISNDNQSNDSEHSFSTAADCSTESSEEHSSVVAPVPGPSGVEIQSPRTPEAERFMCNVCGRGFVTKSNLSQHYRMHSEEKNFVCEKCGKKFQKKSHLVRHMRSHTGEKPFECTECGKRFTQKHHLQNHLRTHTGEKPFKCAKCNKTFSDPSNFNRHVKTHTTEKSFVCAECGKRFFRKHHLENHLKTHASEKPFNCPECGERFTQIESLKRHLNTHTRKRDEPSKCEECEKAYGSQAACNHQHNKRNDGGK